MLCAISGTVPEEPVVSKKSGLLFERRLVEKIIEETGRCPISDEPLEKDDLVPISTPKAIQPRSVPAASIPGLLTLLQNEWDATVLESHQLRQALLASRQELSHALYQHDAACRVIARLLKERDQYRARLEAVQLAAPQVKSTAEANGKRAAEAEAEAEVEEEAHAGKKLRPALGQDVVDAITACSNALSKGRKKRQIPETTATIEQISRYTLKSSFPIHNTRKGGINSIAIARGDSSSSRIAATAGSDGTVQLFDFATEQSVASLTGHKKKVHDVAFVGDSSLLASGAADATVRVWKMSQSDEMSYECSSVLMDQQGDVVAVNVHPTNDYILSASSDGTWCFYDVARAECLAKVAQDEDKDQPVDAYSCARLHPDGLIFSTAGKQSSSSIRVWECRTQKCVAKFDDGANCLSFSENGYYMASCGNYGVKVWDLRKLKCVQDFPSEGKKDVTASVAFDHSGLYLGTGGASARVYAVKKDWDLVHEFNDVARRGVLSLAWEKDAKALLVGGADHNLRLFASDIAE